MTFKDFLSLTNQEQNMLLEKKIKQLTFKRKDPIIEVIGFLRLTVDDSHNNTSWNVCKFDMSINELKEKMERLNRARIGVKVAF